MILNKSKNNFIDKNHSEQKKYNKQIEQIIDKNEPSLLIFCGNNYELEIDDNSIFNIRVDGNKTTGFSWFLENVEELKISNIIEPLNLDEKNGSKDYVVNNGNKKTCGAGEINIFKFKVNNAREKELPKLKFIYKRPWETDGNISICEITLKLKN